MFNMIRTPTTSAVRNIGQIGKTPTTATNHTRRAIFSKQLTSSQQITEILYNPPNM